MSKATRSTRSALRFEVSRSQPSWELSEETMPESALHDEIVSVLRDLLVEWVSSSGRPARVARNLAVRWDETAPKIGIDPDLCVLSPAPPEGESLSSLCTWKLGHAPPLLAIEVVSDTNPAKDYELGPLKYAASGAGELWVFDPRMVGPRSFGGPFRLQLWRRSDGVFDRVYAGDGPVQSPLLGGWLIATSEGQRLRLAHDRDGNGWWLTGQERERIGKEQERLAKERERQAKEAALARVAELEAKLRGA